jgi:hypothetical protein
MLYKCTTPRYIRVELTHAGPLQYTLELCTCNALVVILAFPFTDYYVRNNWEGQHNRKAQNGKSAGGVISEDSVENQLGILPKKFMGTWDTGLGRMVWQRLREGHLGLQLD